MKPLQRKALKDLNRERSLSSGTLAPWKAKMSDFDQEGSLLQKFKARKVGVHIEDEIRPQNDAQAMTSRLQHSPKPSSRLKVSFFSDPSGSESEGPECAGVTPNSTNKYFSTPVTAKGKAKKKLSPVMEMDMESNAVQGGDACQACPMDVVHRSPQGGHTALGGSPPKTPLYRSSFAMECQRIVKQITGSENECRKSPGKRKAEELDVSDIAAEPPPYDSTPFKSLLAWEVTQMLSSVENSPVNEGTSLFGESLLDLERSDMQLQDFSLSDFGTKSGKGRSVNDSGLEGISSLEDKADGESCIKRQKLALPFYKADGLHGESMKTSNNCKADSGTRTSPHELITFSTSLMEELVGSNLTRELKYDGANTSHEGMAPHCPAQADVSKPCVSTTQEICELANTTQELESAPQQFQMLNTTEVMEPLQRVCDITQEIALVTEDNGRENTNIEIKAAPQTSTNVTQHTLSFLGEIAEAASNTWVLEEEPSSSVAAVQGMVASLNAGGSLTNTNLLMVPQTVNTTQEMVSNHEGCVTDTTQEMVSNQDGFVPNTTQEIISNYEGCITDITQEIVSIHEGCVTDAAQEVVSSHEGCVTNITQEVVSIHEGCVTDAAQVVASHEGCVTNITQEVVSSHEGCITNTTQEVVSSHDGCITNTTQEVVASHEVCVIDAAQEVVASHEGCVTNAAQEVVASHEGCVTNTTQEIVSSHEGCITNTTQEIVSSHEGCVIDAAQKVVSNQDGCVPNTTQKGASNHEGCVAITTQEMVLNIGCIFNTTQEMVSNHEGCVANTPQGMVSNHVGCITITTQMIPEPGASAILSVHESSRSANTTEEIRPAPDSGNRTQGIMKQDEGKDKDTGNSTVNRTLAECTADSSNPAHRIMEVCDGATEEVSFAHNGHDGQNQMIDIESKALSPSMPDSVLKDLSGISGVFATMGNSSGSAMNSAEGIKDHITSPKVVPTSLPTCDINESRNLPGPSKDSRNISGCTVSPKEVLIPNKADTIRIGHAEDQISVSDVTHAGHGPENELMIPNKADDLIGTHAEDQIPVSDGAHADRGTLVGTSTQSRPDGQENSGKEEESDIKNDTVYLLNDVLPSKGRFLASESFSIIQEEENVQDVSVFSAGSLSFVTSTPVPGLNNFPFQKSEKPDPNVFLGCVMEPPHKDPTAQSKLVPPTGGNQGHMPQNKGVPGLPTSTQGTALHSQMSGIPTARRALALFPNPTGQAKEPMLSKIPPRGIPGRGSIRPPLARPGLPRPTVGNTKQNIEEKAAIMAPSKLVGSNIKTLKAAAAKPRSAALPSKLPGAPTQPPSQICTPSSGGSSATHNVTQDPAYGVSTAPSTGVKSFLTKPGSSSLQPPLPPSSLKSFIKPKSNHPGLPGRKMQLPLLWSQKKIVPVKGEGPSIKKPAKPPLSATPAAPTRDAAIKGAGKPTIPPSRTQLMRAESSDLPLPVTGTDTAENFCSLETCKCCSQWSERYRILLQAWEELNKQLGPEHHGNTG